MKAAIHQRRGMGAVACAALSGVTGHENLFGLVVGVFEKCMGLMM